MNNPYKVSGPETDYVVGAVRCCRVWPVITASLTYDFTQDMFKREQWWWRSCGICGEIPRPVQEERP